MYIYYEELIYEVEVTYAQMQKMSVTATLSADHIMCSICHEILEELMGS